MKKFIQPTIILGLIIYIFFHDACDRGHSSAPKPTIPAVSGNFGTTVKPAALPAAKDHYVTPVQKAGKEKSVVTEKPVDPEIMQQYVSADSTGQEQMFADAIQENEYCETKEDENVRIDFTAKTRGQLLSYDLKYTRKAVDAPETKWKALGAMEFGNNKEFDNFTAKANVIIQTRKGHYSVSVDTNQMFWAGIGTTIFERRK